jgi:EAL domain-containing protein (putative c-di-GMP-specific phosphodiesterase class I)
LGTEIGIKVVAEGVERRGEADALRAVGLRFMQGFYFARPVFEGSASVHAALAEFDVLQAATGAT